MIQKKYLPLAVALMVVCVQLYAMGPRQKTQAIKEIRTLLNTPLVEWNQDHINQIDQKIKDLKPADPSQANVFKAELDNLENQMGYQQKQLRAMPADDKEINILKKKIDTLEKQIAQLKKDIENTSAQKIRAEEAFFAAKKAYENRITQIENSVLNAYEIIEPAKARTVLKLSIQRAHEEADKIHKDYYGTNRPR